eukprot:939872_1
MKSSFITASTVPSFVPSSIPVYPLLTIPGSCGSNTRAKTGCYKRQGVPSGLPNTYERFDGFEGEVEWRMAGFSFVNATGSLLGPELLTFGVVDDDIMSGPGGVFFGLIKNTDSWIRPTFLGQTDIKSFTVDLMTHSRYPPYRPSTPKSNDIFPSQTICVNMVTPCSITVPLPHHCPSMGINSSLLIANLYMSYLIQVSQVWW